MVIYWSSGIYRWDVGAVWSVVSWFRKNDCSLLSRIAAPPAKIISSDSVMTSLFLDRLFSEDLSPGNLGHHILARTLLRFDFETFGKLASEEISVFSVSLSLFASSTSFGSVIGVGDQDVSFSSHDQDREWPMISLSELLSSKFFSKQINRI